MVLNVHTDADGIEEIVRADGGGTVRRNCRQSDPCGHEQDRPEGKSKESGECHGLNVRRLTGRDENVVHLPLRMADPRQGSRLRVNLKEKDRWLAN